MSFTITPLLMRAGREERRKEEQQKLPDSSRLISWAYPRFFKQICDRLLIKVNTSLQTFRCAEFLSQLCTMWARDEPRMGRLNAFVAFPEKFSSVIFLVHVPIMLHSCLICCTAMKSVSFSPFLGQLKFWCVFPPPGRVLLLCLQHFLHFQGQKNIWISLYDACLLGNFFVILCGVKILENRKLLYKCESPCPVWDGQGKWKWQDKGRQDSIHYLARPE